MKSIFVDCNSQLAPVFARVRRPDDPPIAVNTDPFQSADLPRLLAGYDICLDDHSYMPTEQLAHCRGLEHIVFLGTGASSYMDVPAILAALPAKWRSTSPSLSSKQGGPNRQRKQQLRIQGPWPAAMKCSKRRSAA